MAKPISKPCTDLAEPLAISFCVLITMHGLLYKSTILLAIIPAPILPPIPRNMLNIPKFFSAIAVDAIVEG